MQKFSKEEIEGFFTETTSGFYLSQCVENGGEDEKGFYRNQLDEFTAGFECCLDKINGAL